MGWGKEGEKMKIKELFVFVIFGISLSAILMFLRATNQIDTAQFINIFVASILLIVTVIYVVRTAEIAKATEKQAKASLKMAESMTKPCILLRLDTKDGYVIQYKNRLPPEFLNISVMNAGSGPAINLDAMLWKNKCHYPSSTKGYLAQNEHWQVGLDAEMEIENTKISSLQNELINQGISYAIIINYEDMNKHKITSYLTLDIIENQYLMDGEQHIVELKKTND
jgi:hypothetical protein